MACRLVIDESFPKMDASSAVFPSVRIILSDLFLAYHLPHCHDSAVACFRGFGDWSYGPPNDEGLHQHPLWDSGLTFYNFHRQALEGRTERHWIASFHDGLFEIRAQAVDILEDRVKNCRPWEALNLTLGTGYNCVLDQQRNL